MKLFLTSTGFGTENNKEAYFSLLPNRNQPPKIAWIADAAEPYVAKGPTVWLEESKSELEKAGLQLVPIRLLDYAGRANELKALLVPLDGVWCSGGNTHYLRYAMAESGFDHTIRGLMESGLVYAGGSAGAMVVAPSIELSEDAADLADVPTIIEEGLGLYDELILPHWNVPEYKEELLKIDRHHKAAGRKTHFLNNGEVVIVRE